MPRIGLTRLELKRQRERLARFQRYLPSLRLRQQQLQRALLEHGQQLEAARGAHTAARANFDRYRGLLQEGAGFDLDGAARPCRVLTATRNIAGVQIPVLEQVEFADVAYSLFGTPPWVDAAVRDLRLVARWETAVALLEQAAERLHTELQRVMQRVNLFEKVKIPEAEQHIHRIRVHLGDEMAAAVGRAKIAKARITGRSGEAA